jgi:hypothetical protein
MNLRRFFVKVLVLIALAGPAYGTLIDFNIHQDGSDAHTLKLQYPSLVAQPYELFPIEFGPLAGYFGSIEPGWDGEGTDRPDEGAFALLSTEGVALRRDAFEAGFSMYTEGLTPILEFDGDTHEFAGLPEGPGLLWHEHLLFVADPGTPLNTVLTAQFTLVDLDGLHGDSAPFTLSFIVTPEPAGALILGLAAARAITRRTRRAG